MEEASFTTMGQCMTFTNSLAKTTYQIRVICTGATPVYKEWTGETERRTKNKAHCHLVGWQVPFSLTVDTWNDVLTHYCCLAFFDPACWRVP